MGARTDQRAKDFRSWMHRSFTITGTGKKALTDWQLATLLLKTQSTPFSLTDKFFAALPMRSLFALSNLVFTKLHTHPITHKPYRYTTDPFNEVYTGHNSWVMPVSEQEEFTFSTKAKFTADRKFARKYHYNTDLIGLYRALKKHLKCVPAPWLRPLWYASTAAQHKLLTSRDFDLVFAHEGPFAQWLLYYVGGEWFGYSLKHRPHQRKQWIRTEMPPMAYTHFLGQMKKCNRDFALVLYLYDHPLTSKAEAQLADVLYWGSDTFRHPWSYRKRALPRVAEALGVRPALGLPKKALPGQTLVFRHVDSKPFIYSHGAAKSPGKRWYTFLLLSFAAEGEQVQLQLGLWDGRKALPFTREVSVPARNVSEPNSGKWEAVERVAVLADTLRPKGPLRIYQIQPSLCGRTNEQITFQHLMET